MKHNDYWKQRFIQLENAQHGMTVQAFADIEQLYQQAQREISGQIALWYQRFADNNKISLADARQWLSGNALKELKWDVKEYIKYGKENAINGQWIKQLENASAKFHISKLEALKIHTQQSLEKLFSKQESTIEGLLGDVYKSGYYHTAYELQKGFGIGFDIAAVDQPYLEKVLAKPWAADGKNFSERVWGNKAKIIQEAHTELSRNILTGGDPQKAIDALSKKFQTSKYNAGRLIQTEQAYFSSVAQKQCFKDLGVEEYEIVATLDSHTSDICQGLDGQHFPMKDFEAGITAPPFHVNCRSTTAPYFAENFGQIGGRAARDAETGKTYYVPDDLKYADWKAAFVDGGRKPFTTMNQHDTISARDGVGKVSDLIHSELAVVVDNGLRNDYRVNYDLVNSKAYHDKFEGLTQHKSVDEGLYKRAAKMLEHRSGSPYEDIAMLDARTGEVLMENTSAAGDMIFKSGLTQEQYAELVATERPFEILHNHPGSSIPSTADIEGLFERGNAVASTVIGHNGSVYRIEKLKGFSNIKGLIKEMHERARMDYAGFADDVVEYHTVMDLLEYLQRNRFVAYKER